MSITTRLENPAIMNDLPITQDNSGKDSNSTINSKADMQSAELWHKLAWKDINTKVAQLQEEILVAAQKKDMTKAYKLQRKLILSFEGRALAVRRVVTNSGGKTPGIDNKILNDPAEYYEAIKWIKNIVEIPKNYKASPLKRVWIPKPGKKGEKRGLGIPTVHDRLIQAVYQMAVDPIVENQSDLNSFGFRKKRSTQDAVIYLKNYMDKHYAPRWVLEAVISKCFDKISHEFLMKHTPICDKTVLEQWLKSGVIESGEFRRTDEGTPQGGIISPVLCNIALNGLEQLVKDSVKWNTGKISPGIKVIRYADDIVITAKEKETLDGVRERLKEFLGVRGLTLSEEKTIITHIQKGIDLLGFNIRRQPWSWRLNDKNAQKDILIVKPSEKGITNIKTKIKATIKGYNKMEDIVTNLNPILRGWAEHKRITPYARNAFFEIDNYVWERLRTKFVNSKPGQRRVRNNFAAISKEKGRWGDENGRLIISLARIGTKQLRLKQLNKNPYLLENAEYFNQYKNSQVLTNTKEKLYKKYKNTCEVCKDPLDNGEAIEIHHKTPIGKGGTNKISNLIPLHRICHMKVTHERTS